MKQSINYLFISISNYSLLLKVIIYNLALISTILLLLVFTQDIFMAEDLNWLDSLTNSSLKEPVQEIVVESDKVNLPAHHQESILTEKAGNIPESKPFYTNPYFIGVSIIITVVGIVLWYRISGEDISDTESIASSTSTIVSDVSSTPTLVNPRLYRINNIPFDQLPDLIVYCDKATRNFGLYELSDISPLLGNFITTDSMFIQLFRSKLEQNDLEFFNFLNLQLGIAPLRIFQNPYYMEIFSNWWTPSQIYPTYQSFVTYFTLKYNEYLNLTVD